ncbi:MULTISPECIES: DNA cytosine methyltransferase [unclassified Caballeronia]|jgi:DNA (cytosine-5)-methyltransferase 1|uniref:DNA cytosine methyltransferase n=1 Tax=unclassified Caballeronia TaxID=2646786 RepID=UPI002027BAE1|nr:MULTISPECIES: DNA cytosine methyltransferase [unclassified Caballeronia]
MKTKKSSQTAVKTPTFYEFFAGGGMARAGLGKDWHCLFANDFDQKKGNSYKANWGGKDLVIGDVAKVEPANLPDHADLAWASFPCQDLSLAGAGAGLDGERSGTFWPFWDLMRRLGKEDRAPRMIVLENVCGALTSHGGKDFAAIASALSGADYKFGAVVIDAVNFVPQSRPRLFIIAVAPGHPIPADLVDEGPSQPWHTDSLIQACASLSGRARSKWLWWRLPTPESRTQTFADIIEDDPQGVSWHTAAETERLVSLMSDLHLKKLAAAKKAGRRMVGAVYRRTRPDGAGGKVQRAEVRFDDVAGCLRTPGGGSSRQSIIVVDGERVRSRLLSPREAARLMGLSEKYVLPPNYNDAYHLAGDGLAVPVVRFLAANILEPVLAATEIKKVA